MLKGLAIGPSVDVRRAIPPLLGALLQNEAGVMLFERLALVALRLAG